MKVLTVYAHPNPKSFCHAILQQFAKGLEDAGHTSYPIATCPPSCARVRSSPNSAKQRRRTYNEYFNEDVTGGVCPIQ